MRQIKCLLLFTLIAPAVFAGNSADTTRPVKSPGSAKDSNVLIVVDGKIMGFNKDFPSIDDKVKPDSIKLVNVLKGSRATDKYGEKGKDGVIEIFTKNIPEGIKITDEDLSAPSDDNKTFEKVEIEASFPGGTEEWVHFLERTLNANTPVEYGAPAGTYTVVVQFVVDKYGNISEIKALTNHGYGMEKEVIRVIKLGPKWNPAIQDGRQVKAYRKQPVTFVITEEGRKRKREKKD